MMSSFYQIIEFNEIQTLTLICYINYLTVGIIGKNEVHMTSSMTGATGFGAGRIRLLEGMSLDNYLTTLLSSNNYYISAYRI